MSDFRVQPDRLRQQSSELEAVYSAMCGTVAELGGIVRSLGSMSGFDGAIETIRRVQKTGDEQQRKLRRCVQTLEQAAEFYAAAETKNLDGSTAPLRRVPLFHQSIGALPREDAAVRGETLRPVEMLPFAEALFGTKIVIK